MSYLKLTELSISKLITRMVAKVIDVKDPTSPTSTVASVLVNSARYKLARCLNSSDSEFFKSGVQCSKMTTSKSTMT